MLCRVVILHKERLTLDKSLSDTALGVHLNAP